MSAKPWPWPAASSSLAPFWNLLTANRLPLIFAIPSGEYPSEGQGSPDARSTRARERSDLRALKTEFEFAVTTSGATGAAAIRNAPTEANKVVLIACIAFCLRRRHRNHESHEAAVGCWILHQRRREKWAHKSCAVRLPTRAGK